MTYRLLEYDCPSFRCDRCDVIAASNRARCGPSLRWKAGQRLERTATLCVRCIDKLPPWEPISHPGHRDVDGHSQRRSSLVPSPFAL